MAEHPSTSPYTDLIVKLLQEDPACNGRVTTSTVNQITEQVIAKLETRALNAEALLSSMMRGGELGMQALHEAYDTMGYLHACMFGAEQHLREHGWLKPEPVDSEQEMPF